jgi:UPF0716 protein FxsA
MPVIFFALFVGFPLLELWVAWRVSLELGFWETLFLLISGVVVGIWTTRLQGRMIWRKMQNQIAAGEVPAQQALKGVLVFLAGVLFILPGFVSDALALVLLFPPTRWVLAGLLMNAVKNAMQRGTFRFKRTHRQGPRPAQYGPTVVDVEAESVREELANGRTKPSPGDGYKE